MMKFKRGLIKVITGANIGLRFSIGLCSLIFLYQFVNVNWFVYIISIAGLSVFVIYPYIKWCPNKK